MSEARTIRVPVVAQDPGVRRRGRILTTELAIPFEDFEPGPIGHRVHVVDYDASTRSFYRPAKLLPVGADDDLTDTLILGDPRFHAHNVYALVVGTLGRFEQALGRRVEWGFRTHQLKVVPHAFEAANAFYSEESEALLFGYFRRGSRMVFTCLSHDIVVHETAHALLAGLRNRFMAPSSPDQAAFHEGYADIVALLSVFSMGEVLVDLMVQADGRASTARRGLVHRDTVSPDRLRQSVLFGLADQMEPEIAGARVNALRRSVDLGPDPGWLSRAEFSEPHRRGEVLVAAVMRAFLEVWSRRLKSLGYIDGAFLDVRRVVDEGAAAADQLLTMAIRALDYTPPIHLRFGDFLSAMLTADSEVRDDDSRYELRTSLLRWFARYGIQPASETPDGLWRRSDLPLAREGVRFGNLQTDPTEMFRLVWANRRHLNLQGPASMRINSLRPCLRIGPEDGLPVRETVAECLQHLTVDAAELPRYGLHPPPGMPEHTRVVLEGGSTLVLDEYGMLKFEIHNRLPRGGDDTVLERAQSRIDYLWERGFYDEGASLVSGLSALHRRRVLASADTRGEEW